MSLPAHVVAVEADRIRLGGQCGGLRDALRASPYAEQVFRDHQLALCLRIPAGANPLSEPLVIELFEWLNRQQVAFVEDLSVPYGPGEVMRALRAAKEVGPFRSLLVRSPEDWELLEHP